jgi:DNA polymerase/3'-5' exonuclease PolX
MNIQPLYADRYALTDALPVVNDLIAKHLNTYEDQIKVCGSIRRLLSTPADRNLANRTVSDAELVILADIPSAFNARLDKLIATGVAKKHRYGEKGLYRWGPLYRGIDYRGFKVEFFHATPDNAGYQEWLRTGPGHANTFIMERRLFASGVKFSGGYGHFNGRKFAIRTEEEMFAVLRMPYIAPHERSESTYRAAFGKRPAPSADWFAERYIADDSAPSQSSMF